MIVRGAWVGGGYTLGQTGTLGESLASSSDNLGWTIRSWKYELDYNGFTGLMKLDMATFGDAMRNQVAAFQQQEQLAIDGVIGPNTGKVLLGLRIFTVASQQGLDAAEFALLHGDMRGIVAHESAWDVGAIGFVDSGDRGPTQQHITPGGKINLSQAIRPALAIPRLCTQLVRLRKLWDEDAAVVSWNCGESGAEWWFEHAKPTSGSPTWWPSMAGDLSVRATAYLAAVRTLAH